MYFDGIDFFRNIMRLIRGDVFFKTQRQILNKGLLLKYVCKARFTKKMHYFSEGVVFIL